MSKHAVMMIFPPTTEARFFPYLSLPVITAYLRQQGESVSQRDFNIELCQRLFTPEVLRRYRHGLEESHAEELTTAYRRTFVDYLLSHHGELYQGCFDKERTVYSEPHQDVPMRIVRQGVEMLLEGSILKREITTFAELDEVLHTYSNIDESDIAAQLQHEMLVEAVTGTQPEVVAISVAFYSQLLPSLLLAKWVRENEPQTRVILGGPQMMRFVDQLWQEVPFAKQYLDAIGVGAGEDTLLNLLKSIRGEIPRSEVPNVIWMDDGTRTPPPPRPVTFRDLPPPDFADLPIRSYMSEGVQLALVTCEGCYWGRCAFCSYGNKSRKTGSYRQKTPSQIADECQVLVERYGISRINFVDENTNLRLVLSAMRLLNERGVQVMFSTRNRLEDTLLDREFCAELRRRGLVQMSCGFETYSQRLLDLMEKGVHADHYQQILDNLFEKGIEVRLSVMGGLPTETPEEAQRTMTFLRDNQEKIGIDVLEMLVAEPETFLTERPDRYGISVSTMEGMRGNRGLNYGMGRMGYTYHYMQGEGYEQRLEWLCQVFEQVNPGMKEEVRPKIRIDRVELFPWVQLITGRVESGAPLGKYLADLLRERVFILPDQVGVQDRCLSARDAKDEEVSAFLQDLLMQGLGRSIASP